MAEEKPSESQPPFDLLLSNAVPHIFSDGLSQMQIGYPFSTLFLHDVTMPPRTEGSKEQRRVNLVLQMPTVSLVEVARIILTAVKEVSPQLSAASADQQTKLLEMLSTASIEQLSKP